MSKANALQWPLSTNSVVAEKHFCSKEKFVMQIICNDNILLISTISRCFIYVFFLAALAALCLPLSSVIVMHIGCVGFKAFQPSRPNRNLAKLMRVTKKHDLTNKNTRIKTNAKTKTMTMTITFREYLQRAFLSFGGG